jgi:hypothetical protein
MKLNFQGFPTSQCVYDEDMEDYVYQPMCWWSRTFVGINHKTCPDCHLKPCFMQVCGYDIWKHAAFLKRFAFRSSNNGEVVEEAMGYASELFTNSLGRNWSKQYHGIPGCVVNALKTKYPFESPLGMALTCNEDVEVEELFEFEEVEAEVKKKKIDFEDNKQDVIDVIIYEDNKQDVIDVIIYGLIDPDDDDVTDESFLQKKCSLSSVFLSGPDDDDEEDEETEIPVIQYGEL